MLHIQVPQSNDDNGNILDGSDILPLLRYDPQSGRRKHDKVLLLLGLRNWYHFEMEVVRVGMDGL